MIKAATVFLQGFTVLIGVGAFAFLLWEPRIEGRNAGATDFEIYFNDPFLAFAYVGSIPFFIALWKVFRVLGYAGRDKILTVEAVKALRTIRYCAMILIGFVAVGEVFILLGESDDRTGGYFMGFLVALGAAVMAAAATVLEGILHKGIANKREHVPQEDAENQ